MKCYENHISAYLKVELFHDKQCGVLSQCVKILKNNFWLGLHRCHDTTITQILLSILYMVLS